MLPSRLAINSRILAELKHISSSIRVKIPINEGTSSTGATKTAASDIPPDASISDSISAGYICSPSIISISSSRPRTLTVPSLLMRAASPIAYHSLTFLRGLSFPLFTPIVMEGPLTSNSPATPERHGRPLESTTRRSYPGTTRPVTPGA